MLLKYKGRSEEDIDFYIEAYDFFCRFTTKFDGATIVKDLCDLPKLDADAMVHDYDYLCGANKSFKRKWKSDIDYIKNMEKNGKGIRIVRLILLTIAGIVFVPYCKFFR